MGMLGHQARAAGPGPDGAELAPPEVDKEAADIAALEEELHMAELGGPDTDLARRSELLAAVRARLEPLLGQSHGSAATMLRATLHGLTQALVHVPAALDAGADAPENKFRTSVVELLGRIPFSEMPKQKVADVLHACHRVLETDHEENGLVVQRMLFDIHKGWKVGLEEQTAPFFKWLEGLFDALPATVERQMSAAAVAGEGAAPGPLVPARESLKLAIDVALMVFYLMQAYPKRMIMHGPTLVPLMVKVVALPGPDKEDVPAAAASVYSDFRLAQIKTLAFMIVVSRAQQMAPMLVPHRDEVCSAMIRIMRTVPDVLTTRKELLTCMRNMLNTPFKEGLRSKIDALLDERTLLGTDRACVDALRQLAYMNLAELVAVTKQELSVEQLQRVVKLYTRNALDALNPASLQTTSLRLLYNVIEVLFSGRGRNPEHAEACREMLSAILDCMVAKLGALRHQVPRRVCELRDLEDARRHRKEAEAAAAADNVAAGKKSLAEQKRKIEEAGAVAKAAAEAEAAAAAAKAAEEAAAAAAAAQAAAAAEAAAQPVVKQEDGGAVPAEGAVAAGAAAPAEAGAAEPMATDAAAPAAEEPAAPAAAAAATAPAEAAAPPAAAAPAVAEPKAEPMETETAAAAAPSAAAASEKAEGEKEGEKEGEGAPTGPPPPPFRVLLQSTVGSSAKEREILEFRTLLHTVINCLKNVLYITVAFHTSRGLSVPLPFQIKPWSSRVQDVRCVTHVLTFGLPAISFFEHATPPGFDAREALADLFTAIPDGREFADVFAPRVPFLFDLILANRWYMRFLRHLIEGEAASRTYVNRHAMAALLRFLVGEKLGTLADTESDEGKLTLELLEVCFEALPRIQGTDAQRMQHMAHAGVPPVERVVLPHIIAFLRAAYPRVAAGGPGAAGYARAMRTLFYSLAVTNKFQEIQAAVGATGLHLRIVDTALALMQGPSCRSREAQEAAAELCLLVPARLEHLIPVLPRMMHAVVLALNGSDRSVHVALRVLDVWVESFNPEFIERSMAAVTKPLMAALWAHIRPPPHPFGAKVAEMLGKMGGRGRRWLGEGTSVDFKPIPEYGLRVILAFPPHTSFLVPLDRCVQLAWATVESGTADVHRRKNALRLLQICVGTLARMHLPADMVKAHPPPAPTVPASETTAAAGAAAAAAPTATTAAAPAGDAAATATTADQPIAEGAAPTEGAAPAAAAAASGPAPASTTGAAAPSGSSGQPELVDDALGRLQALLFGNNPTPEIPAELNWPSELGVKTKKQHAAEKQMLETVLTALMASAAVDSELEGAQAREFAHSMCRHFALLMAAGWAGATPARPAPPSSRVDRYNVGKGKPAFVAALKHLQPHVVLDAFQQGLRQNNAKARAAVVECMEVFLDTLTEVGEVLVRENAKDGGEGDKATGAPTGASAGVPPAAGAESDKASMLANEPFMMIKQDLVMRAMHCCYGDTWASRLGGIAALEALTKRVPQHWLRLAASYIIKALMGVLRTLPDNAAQEQEEITAVLLEIVCRALGLPESALEDFKANPTAAAAPRAVDGAAPGSDGKETPMDVEQEPEEEVAAATGKRGKRTKRGGAQPPRKRQQRGTSAVPEESPTQAAAAAEPSTPVEGAAGGERSDDDPAVDAARRLQNDLLGSVVSSKSNDAVRSAGTRCLELLTRFTGLTVGALMKNMLERAAAAEAASKPDAGAKKTDADAKGEGKGEGASESQKQGSEAATPGPSGAQGKAKEAPTPGPGKAGQQAATRGLGALLERRMLPLRSIATQTNYAHSTAFLLRTCGEQLEFTSSLASFLADCCTIMELDDGKIASVALVRGQAPKPDVITKLRVSCMEVLVASLDWPAFRAADEVEVKAHTWLATPGEEELKMTGLALRERIAKLFIHKLGSPDEKIVDLSAVGLKNLVANETLKKEVLHDALRPILMDLAVYHRMTVPLLRHVHRLLDLMTGQFNVTLGQKLTEHLQKWMEADKYLYGPALQHPVAWEPGTEAEVAASALDIFHKLPTSAIEFLETHDNRPGIVVLTIGLEEALNQLPGTLLPKKMWSPYRAPLTRFLNRYAQESVAYFLDTKNRLSNPEYFLRLLDIVRNPLGRPLLQALQAAPEKFIAVLEDESADDETLRAQINCIHLLRAMVKLSPSWLPKELFEVLHKRWRSDGRRSRAVAPDGRPGSQTKESKWLAHLLMNYARRNPEELDVLFDLMTALSLHTDMDFGFVRDFLSKELPREFSVEQKKALLQCWIKRFQAGNAEGEDGVNAVRYLINPGVLWAVTHGQESMFSSDLANSLVSDVFRTLSTEAGAYSDQLQAEAIQLCSIVLQHAHVLFKDQRKEIIQYVWWTLKQDNLAKPYAFLCVAHFFHAFRGAQDNVVLKAFVNMVRMTPSDAASREAVRQAIDIIIPILVESPDAGSGPSDTEMSDVTSPGSFPGDVSAVLAGGSGSSRKRPSYAAHLRKVLSEEGSNSTTFLIVLQMVVRNRELFYSARSTFIPYMLKHLQRLGLHNQAPLENRILAVDMAATLLWWDAQAAAETSTSSAPDADEPQAMETDTADGDGTGAKDAATRSVRLTPEMDEEIINFLLRVAFVSCEVREQVRDEAGWRKLHAHCLDVLKDAARHRPPSQLKLLFFEKLLTQSVQHQQSQTQPGQPAMDASPPLVTGLRVLNIFLEFQPNNIVTCCPNQIAMMIEPAIYSKHRAPVELLAAAARSLFVAFPPASAMLVREADKMAAIALKIQHRIRDVLQKYLNHIADPNIQCNPDLFWFGCNCVNVMKACMEVAPDSMQDVMYSLLKAMNRVAKEHNSQPQMGLLYCKAPAREVPTDSEYSTGTWFMYHALNIAVPSSLVLSAEHRKMFLSTLVMLITGQSVRQGQTDAAILFTVKNLMQGWLRAPKPTHLTHKELLVLLQRLAQVDRLHAIPLPLKASWDAQFLDLLYTVITTKKEDNFGEEVFARVERTFCCGLHSSDPVVRQKFFRLYSDRIQRDLYERLRYIIQYQDWDFLSHTFWLKHAVALLFDCLHMRDPITLAYNSAHVPPLFNYKESLKFPGGLLAQAATAQQQSTKPAEGTATAPAPATATEGGAAGGAAADGAAPAAAEGTGAGQGPEAMDAQPAEGAAAAAGDAATEQKASGAVSGAAAPASGTAPSGSKASGSKGSKREKTPAPVLNLDLPDGLRSQLTQHLEFLAQQNTLRSDSLVSCLMEQVQTDPLVAHHLWVLLFPIVWTSLQKEQQTGLAKPIITLLSKEHHLRQAYLRPTVGQTLLDGISMSQPQPKIPAEMIKYMGRHFHAWHTAISMLESHVGLFPQDMRCFDAVCDLYTALGEEDMRAGLWQRRAAADETKTAMALQQHGYIADAQSLYLEMMSRGVSGGVSGVTKSEMVLWHNQYLACCMELNQWDIISEYAKSTDNSALQLEASAKLHDWVHLRSMAVPKAQVEEGPEFTMIKAQMQLSDMSMMEVDKLVKTTLNQCVLRWWQMPESSPYSYAPVLHSFQRAVELMESWRVMMEFSMQGGVNQQYQDLRDITDTWKLRTPNEWEPVRWWSDILTWRNQIYNMTIRQFASFQTTAPNLHQMGYRDKAWSVNRLGHVARQHHLPEACCHIINTMYGFNAMEVQEAFVKVQEQAKAYMMRPAEYLHGLNLINSTNMDYFQAPHQSEMICLKAQFQQLLNEPDAAHNTFSEALTLWPMCPDAWVNWGRFCDSRYSASKQPSPAVPRPEPQPVWLEYAASCYCQGIRLVGTEARALVPRLLHLLMLDGNGADAVGRPLVALTGEMPSWVWLPWLPQLITSLHRPETAVARRVLMNTAQYHPQFVYWQIRPAMAPFKDQALRAVAAEKAAKDKKDKDEREKKREGDKDKDGDAQMKDAEGGVGDKEGATDRAPSPMVKPMEVIAYENCKEVLEALRAKQSLTLQSLDVLMSELGGAKFCSRTDERLLAVVYTLQYRTYRVLLPASAPIPESLLRELSSVCRACSGRGADGSAAPASQLSKLQQEFAADLDPSSERACKTLGEMGERLKGWRTLMESMIEDLHSAPIKLEEHSPSLADMSLDEIEMPCAAPPSPDGPETVFMERIGADVEVVRRACASSRRITVFGSDGQARTFSVHPASQQMSTAHTEDRVGQLLRAANGVMATHPESRRRGLAFVAPRSLSLLPSGRLIEDDPSATLYIDAYEHYCSRYGREPDAPILHYKARTCTDEGMTKDAAVRRAAYGEIVEKLVTENVFSQYMYKTMVENSRVMWTFKRQFALSTAMSAVACYSLRMTNRVPTKLLVSKARGDIINLELAAHYNDRMQMDMAGESVPFRLTRNMSAFIGPHGFEGTLVAAAVAAAQGLQQDRSPIVSMLALFLRDDLLAFAQRRLGARSISAVNLTPSQMEMATLSNLNHCMTRLEKMGPRNSVIPPSIINPQTNTASPINPQKGMRDLIAVAQSANQLSQMDPNWQAWL